MTSTEKAEVTQEAGPLGVEENETGVPGVVPGRLIAGKYRIIRLLGAGGMGAVYSARHVTLPLDVAVKVMHPHLALDPGVGRRFAREARAVSLLAHSNVVRVQDFGVDGDMPYLVMEMLRGEGLDSWLDKLSAPPPLADVARVASAAFAGLDAAHRIGIIHRDLKPENLFLARGDEGDVVVKLVDFGLAHVDAPEDREGTLTKEGMVAGTPSYMSPEQCRSLVVTPASDLYAMGCVLTTLLQRKPPFDGSSSVDIMTRHMFVPAPPLDRPIESEPIPAALERLRLDLLAKDPEKRPATAEEARRRLLEALDPDSVVARLSTRKGAEEEGSRAERSGWVTAPPSQAPAPVPAAERRVAVLRLSEMDGGVTSSAETALAVQRILVRRVTMGAALPAIDEPVTILDVGDDISGVGELIERIAQVSPSTRVVVCAARMTAERINILIAAGAADVVGYPVAADSLGKKIDRALRTKRRK